MADEKETKQLKETIATKKDVEKTEVALANHIIKMETHLTKRIDALNDKYEKILTSTDAILNIVSDQRDEQSLIAKDQEKHKNWIKQIAVETDVVLQD